MRRPRATGMAHSVHVRLKSEADRQGRAFDEIVNLYAVERFLHRLGRSPQRERFAVKGAFMLRHWLGGDVRPTKDLDLLAPSDLDERAIRESVAAILGTPVEDDGIEYDPASLGVRPIRPGSSVVGFRARFDGFLGRSVLRHQVDFGLGDSVYPPLVEIDPEGLLDLPIARVRGYTAYTSIAEKLEANIVLGDANSRMKDFHDLDAYSGRLSFDGRVLVESIRRCLARRSTTIPGVLEGLDPRFARNPDNIERWSGFARKAKLGESAPSLEDVLARVRAFALPVLQAVAIGEAFDRRWPPGGPWQSAK